MYHHFYPYKKNRCDTLMYNAVNDRNDSVSISRIDYYKNIDMVLRANNELERPFKIYGSKNPEYVASQLDSLNFSKYYQGIFKKSFNQVSNILRKSNFMVDLLLQPTTAILLLSLRCIRFLSSRKEARLTVSNLSLFLNIFVVR